MAFSFAVLADSHLEPEPAGAPVPRSNARTRRVVAAINALEPAFTVHLGDLVHPTPGLPAVEPAISAAQAILGELQSPLHVIPGNHDVGDKPLAWMPAKAVTEQAVQRFEQNFGAAFRAFDHEECRFVLINAPVLNSGCPAEEAQRGWLERALAGARGRRIFLFAHYPPYLLAADEPSHYDNLDQPARGWLLGLLEHAGIEALFAGHVHNLFRHRHGATECYTAPATSFVRRDYSELFRIGPAPEFGRDDAAKLGFLAVAVDPRGHRVAFRRLDDGGAPTAAPSPHLGVALRHPWCEVVELPCNPPTDAFQRRRVRNDYPLWALAELGLGNLRVPFADLEGEQRLAAIATLRAQGVRVTAFGFGMPPPELAADAVEIILPREAIDGALQQIAALRRASGVRTLLAPLTTSAASLAGGTNLSHHVGQGFALAGGAEIGALFARPEVRAAFAGAVLRIDAREDLWAGLEQVARLRRAAGIAIEVLIGLTPPMPDQAQQDDALIADRVALAAFAALARGIDVSFDSLLDVDRGYYVRNGLLDRRCNPRRAGLVLRNLQTALAPLNEPALDVLALEEGGTACVARDGRQTQCLLLGPPTLKLAQLPVELGQAAGQACCIDLASATRRELALPFRCATPALLIGAGYSPPARRRSSA